MQVYALTSSQSPRETLDLFLTREAAEAELREILEDEPRPEKRAPGRAGRARRAAGVGELNREPERPALSPLGRAAVSQASGSEPS
jgi:hypothetical protein